MQAARPRNDDLRDLVGTGEILRRARRDFAFFAPRALKILDKRGRIVPFRLNVGQRKILEAEERQRAEGRRVRIRVLKSRQWGITTYGLGRSFHFVWGRRGHKVITVGSRGEDVEKAHEIPDRFDELLAPDLRLTRTRERKRRIKFTRTDSAMWVDSAEAVDPGRSTTIQRVHFTEVAKWSLDHYDSAKKAAWNALAPQGEIFEESTPRGRNHWYQAWRECFEPKSEWTGVFLPWFLDATNRLPAIPGVDEDPPTAEERERIRRAEAAHGFRIDDAQVRFWRSKVSELGLAGALQEFPWDDETCFVVRLSAVFDPFTLGAAPWPRIETDVRGARLPEWIAVRELPRAGARYAIGADTASGSPDGDFDAAYVLDRETGREVARLRGRFGTTAMASRLNWTGRWYNGALIAVEGHPSATGVVVARELVQVHRYPRVYHHRNPGVRRERERREPGLPMTAPMKQSLIDALREALRLKEFAYACPDLDRELHDFEYLDGGGMGAPDGAHDDCVMAAAIANWAVRQPWPESGYADLGPIHNF